MNLFHRLAIGGALSLLAESAAAIGAVASLPQPHNITYAPGPTYTANIYVDGNLHTSRTTPVGEDALIDLSIDAIDLPIGMHTLMAQVIGDDGVPTALAQSLFVRVPVSSSGQTYTTNIYVDGNLHTSRTTPVGENALIDLSIDAIGLPIGMHTLMAQVIGDDGVPTDQAQSLFVRVPWELSNVSSPGQTYTTKIYVDGTLYTTKTIKAGEDALIDLSIDAIDLPVGMHTLMAQVISEAGVPTAMAQSTFFRVPIKDAGVEGVKRYQYWLNDNTETLREVVLDNVTNPTQIVTLLDMPLEPFCSRRYEFAIEDGKPAVYAQNDYKMLFIDTNGRSVMGSGRYTDVRVRQDVTPVGVIPNNALTKVEGLGENEIRFYTFPGNAGDSISVSLDGKAMCEVYSPHGNTLIALDGTETEKGPMIGLAENGTYYLAVHDISSAGNSVIIDFRHITNLNAGDDFEYQGIIYTIMDAAGKTCKTKDGGRIKDPDNPGEYIDAAGNTFEGDLIIPGKVTDGVDEYTVTEIGSAGFYDCDGITSLSLPSTLLSIGEKGFADCDGISSLDLPNSVTTIDSYAFMGCPNLGSVNLPDNLANVGEGAFRSCRSLTSVSLPESLTTVSSGMFYGCSSLSSVQFPSSVRKIDAEAFGYCGNIQEAVLPEGLTAIERSAFYGCSGLVNLVLPESLDYIGVNAFCGCSSLQSLTLPDNLTNIDNEAFRDCDALTSVTLPASMQHIGQRAFLNCEAIASVNYGAAHLIEASDNIFSGAVYENAMLEVANAAVADVKATRPWNLFKYAQASDGRIAPSLNAGDEFEYQGITYIVIDEEAKTCKTKDGGQIEDPDNPGEYIDAAGNTYEGDLVIPDKVSDGVDEYTVTEIGRKGFYDCDGITSLSLPAGLQIIESDGFYDCDGILSIYMPNSVTKIKDHAFYSCDNLVSVNLSENLETLLGGAFMHCSSLESVRLPESLTTLSAGLFSGCSSLTSVYLPESLITIGMEAFYGCSSLKEVAIPESVKNIQSWAFGECISLTSVTLPASLEFLQGYVFGNCHELAVINYAASMPITAAENVFSPAAYANATLNMPDATVADIRATVPWNLFKYAVASDGEIAPNLKAGDDFEYQGIKYTVVDAEAKTCKTKDGYRTDDPGNPGSEISEAGNEYAGDLVIPAIVTDGIDNYSVVAIGELGFYANSGLASASMPESVATIGNAAFAGCRDLASLTLPESVTGIGTSAFESCASLSYVILPEGLSSIGDKAFSNCEAIDSVYYGAAHPIEGSDNVFSGVAYANALLKMPNATHAAIQSAAPWRLFSKVAAWDLNSGDKFECDGITYIVIDEIEKICETASGTAGSPGNEYAGDLVIPDIVTDGKDGYTVGGIGAYGFYGSGYLTSVTLPASVEAIGDEAFAGCPRLTSVVWTAQSRMPESVTEAIANPNLLVYVTDRQYAPAGMSDNVVVMDMETGKAECQKLVLQPGYPFGAVRDFDALSSTMTKEFTQTTPIGGCAGWETIVLPFNATSVAVHDARGELTPFALINDIITQYPYWLYEADGSGEWKSAFGIQAGVPYLISMPNSPEYADRYRIHGPVTFSNPGRTTITPETTAPYAVTWASGRQFRPLWLPLDATEATGAMGLNVGMDNLTDDGGNPLAPGSAFHADVEPRPLEAYVTRIDSRRSLPVMGGQAHLASMMADDGLIVRVENGTIYVLSSSDRRIELYCVDGLRLGSFDVKGGEPLKIGGLVKGMYIVAGKKVIIK